jgi:hypothetical protein
MLVEDMAAFLADLVCTGLFVVDGWHRSPADDTADPTATHPVDGIAGR